MVEPKVSLILTLPGGVMISQQVAENKPELHEEHTMKIKGFRYTKNKKEPDTIVFNTRKSIPARQVLKMSLEAYKYMLDTPTNQKYNSIVAKSKGKPIRVWDTMTEEARIKKHCELIANDMGAVDFEFVILDE